jgi:hypothetical protein
MLHTVKQVEYLGEYKLNLTFNDNCTRFIDLEDWLKNAKNLLLSLKDPNYFRKVGLDGITICWPNGIDICPDTLYETSKKVK